MNQYEEFKAKLKPIPHPLKSRLKKLGLKQVEVAFYLGISTGTLSAWLNCTSPMPEVMEQRLEKLVRHLERLKEASHES